MGSCLLLWLTACPRCNPGDLNYWTAAVFNGHLHVGTHYCLGSETASQATGRRGTRCFRFVFTLDANAPVINPCHGVAAAAAVVVLAGRRRALEACDAMMEVYEIRWPSPHAAVNILV